MKIYDISLTLSESVPVWPGDEKPTFKKIMQLHEGDLANVTHMSLGAHTGTHVDAPLHFLKEGRGIEALSLEALIGQAFVVEAPNVDLLTKEVLEGLNIPENTERLLIKTRNSKLWARGVKEFTQDYVAIDGSGAQYLVDQEIKLVGVDYLSVSPFDDPVPTHEVLLKADVVILEGINLSEVKPGSYALYCLPLKIEGSDGAPARVVLIG